MGERASGRLVGKVAIVTGGANGIGAGTAQLLFDEGARVVVADIDGDAASARAASIDPSGTDVIGMAADVADEDAVAALVNNTVQHFGALHILHNNACAMQLTPLDTTVVDVPLDVWDGTMEVSLRGSMLVTRAAIPHMIEAGTGSIVYTASVQALLGDTGQTAYAAAKHALIALSRSVATQYGRQGIRSNVICPGLIVTERLAAKLDDAALERLSIHQVLSHRGSAKDIAETVLFLSADSGAFITGQTLVVDGGASMHMPSYADGGNIKRD